MRINIQQYLIQASLLLMQGDFRHQESYNGKRNEVKTLKFAGTHQQVRDNKNIAVC